MQSEFYAKLDPRSARSTARRSTCSTATRLRAAQPTHTVFNGVHNGMVAKPLPAKPGERVRLFVLNVGPSKTSSFHVVGTIFDRVWFEGNPDNQFRGMQTVLLGSSNSAIVEFVIPEDGLVHHGRPSLRQRLAGRDRHHLDRDAAGQAELEHHNIPATATPTDPDGAAGQARVREQVPRVPLDGAGHKLGPDLAGVTKRRSDAWLARWLKAPGQDARDRCRTRRRC